jgi:hypothetical protein
MRHTSAPAVLLASFMVACATGKNLDTSRPVEIKDGMYRQGGQPVLVPDLEDKLAEHPAAGPELSGYKAKKWTAWILASVGGSLVGWNLGDNLTKTGKKNWTPTLVGAGAVVVAMPLALMADGQMRSAVNAYNSSFTQAQSSEPGEPVPFIVVLPEPEGGKQCLAGVTMSF